VFQADPPDTTRIPEQDALGVTIVLLTCSYKGQEFVRVGYFINNEYNDQEQKENPPAKPQFEKMSRNILASKPRVTRFKINWDDTSNTEDDQNVEDGVGTSGEVVQTGENGMEWNEELEMNEGGNSLQLMGNGNENSNSLAMEC
jgi:histone chaperone ASF1